MQHPDEGTIHAWIDGELSQADATALETHLAVCAECSAMAAEARGLVAASSRIVSALDIIPGGVIPAARAKRRPWYMSTQLRAAAAIAVVAGASMLVMRDRKEATMDSVLSATAPAPAAVESDRSAAPRETPATSAANTPADAGQQLKKEKAEAAPPRRLERQSAGKVSEASSPPATAGSAAAAPASTAPAPTAQAIAAPIAAPLPPPPARSAADEARSAKIAAAERDSAQRRSNIMLSDVVVTGAAAGVPALKELRTDSSSNRVRLTFYQVSPGLEVTLSDVEPSPLLKLEKARGNVSTPPMASRVAADAQSMKSISWIDKRGHSMTLSGPVSKEQLERIRKLLPEDKR
jgi:putative zinc finger protein